MVAWKSKTTISTRRRADSGFGIRHRSSSEAPCWPRGVAVNLNLVWDLEDIERAAGLDPDSADYRLREALAREDSDFLEQLVQMRKDKGLTQQSVAERMHRDKSAVSNFERLSSDPHLSTIRRYAAAIGACISHQVQDFDLINSADYREVLDTRLDGVIKQWRTYVACELDSHIQTVGSDLPVESDRTGDEHFGSNDDDGVVVYLDLRRSPNYGRAAHDCIACDG